MATSKPRPTNREPKSVLRNPADRDLALVLAARDSFGIVDMEDLARCGFDKRAAWRRNNRAALFRLHRGVYSVVPPEMLRPEGRWLAAVKAARTTAGLSLGHAGALWDMGDTPRGPVNVSVPGSGGRSRRPGLVIHRCPTLDASDLTVERGIPVTTPARTLKDLKRISTPAKFDEYLRRAAQRGLDMGGFVVDDPDRTELERRFTWVCRNHEVPPPETQRIIGPYTVDFIWPRRRLIVETDGFGTHGSRERFEADRERDAWLTTQGYRVIRFTWRQLQDDPAGVARTLRRVLAM